MSQLTIKKLTIDPVALKALSVERRSSILLVGHLLNEANWLRKLLVQATLAISDRPEGQAQFGLTIILATTLASKMREGWDRVTGEPFGPVARDLTMPQELVTIRKELNRMMSGSVLKKIRNNYAFHYPRSLDFAKFLDIDRADTTIYGTESGYGGDMFSHISALAALDSLIGYHTAEDWHIALRSLWEEVAEVAGRYCFYISELIARMLVEWLPDSMQTDDIVVTDAPSLDQSPLVFFARPPAALAALHGGQSDSQSVDEA